MNVFNNVGFGLKIKNIDLEKKFCITGDLLRRSICINILVKYNEEMILDPYYDGRLLDIDDLQIGLVVQLE